MTQRDRRAFFQRWANDQYGHVDCWYCGELIWGPTAEGHVLPVAQVEHQTPVCRGGTDAAQNLVPACHPCNADKGQRTLNEYRALVFQRRLDALFAAVKALRKVEQDTGYWSPQKVIGTKVVYLVPWLFEIYLARKHVGVAGVRFAGETSNEFSDVDPYTEARLLAAGVERECFAVQEVRRYEPAVAPPENRVSYALVDRLSVEGDDADA